MGQVLGLVLVVMPVLLYQANPTKPVAEDFSERYGSICIALGFLGGILIARRDDGSLGFLWAGGGMAGALTAGLSYQVSEKLYEDSGNSSVNVFIILLSSLPGLLVYLVVKRLSDYTFPAASSQRPTPPNATRKNSATLERPDFPAKQTTPLLLATKI